MPSGTDDDFPEQTPQPDPVRQPQGDLETDEDFQPELSPLGGSDQPEGWNQPESAQQPELPSPPESPEAPFLPFLESPARVRLARVPDMFGDSLGPPVNLTVDTDMAGNTILLDASLPLAAASRPAKVSEHNSALPDDRVFINFQSFHGALSFEGSALAAGITTSRSTPSVERFTFGAEKTFFDGRASLEVRLPLAGAQFFQFTPPFGPQSFVDGGTAGNLALIAKGIIYADPLTVISTGFGLAIPTGSDVTASSGGTTFRLDNESFHVLPFFAALYQIAPNVFLHGFVQFDITLSGHSLSFANQDGAGSLGIYNDQSLLYIDIGSLSWLYRSSSSDRFIRGIAAVVELHQTLTLNDSDQIDAFIPGPGAMTTSEVILTQPEDSFHVLNLTLGSHLDLPRNATLRLAGVFPLAEGSDRFFDSELVIQLGGRF